jgi:outer membrane protein OmpA-like peptidoglycan-associated protein
MINRNREESMGGPTDQTWTARNADTAVSSNVQLPGINTDRLADQLKSAIARSDGSRVDLDGVSFDRSGTLSPAAMDAINRLGQMIKDNPSLKVTITTSGQSMDEAARRGNTIKSMLAAAGVARERIFVEPQIDGGPVPKVSFTK